MHPVAVLVNVEGQLLMFLSDLAVNCIDVDVHIYCCIIGHIETYEVGDSAQNHGSSFIGHIETYEVGDSAQNHGSSL